MVKQLGEEQEQEAAALYEMGSRRGDTRNQSLRVVAVQQKWQHSDQEGAVATEEISPVLQT